MDKMRHWLYKVLEEQKGGAGSRLLNHFLMILVALNVVSVVLESEHSIYQNHQLFFEVFEAFSVMVFTLEYLVRVWVSVEGPRVNGQSAFRARLAYLLTPMALVDLIAVLPFYLSAFVGVEDLRVLRSLRLLRLLKLTRYSQSLELLLAVLRQEAETLISALLIMCMLILLAATGIYLVEGHVQPESFGSIPRALWWATVTVATVGYGDIVPVTVLGKLFSGTLIVSGIAVAALPAAILASGMINELKRRRENFRNELIASMENGKLDFGGLRYLEKVRIRLGVSRADARLVFEETKQELRLQTRTACPHCGGMIEIKHPPGHIHVHPGHKQHQG